MPNTCENCGHWRKVPAREGAMVATAIGECRAEPPKASHNWPRTHGTEYCSCHSANAPRYAQPQETPAPRRGKQQGELPIR